MRIKPFFCWYDFWVGFYYDRETKKLYFCPIPCFVIEISLRRKIVEKAEEESLCDDCEWFKNPGACPDYDESKCRYNAPMEEEE